MSTEWPQNRSTGLEDTPVWIQCGSAEATPRECWKQDKERYMKIRSTA